MGLVFFALLMSCGYVSLAYGGAPATERVFGGNAENYAAEDGSCTVFQGNSARSMRCSDPEVLRRYIAGLRLYSLTGDYRLLPEDGENLVVIYQPVGRDGPAVGVDLSDHALTVTRFGEKIRQERYYLMDGPDWTWLHTLLKEQNTEEESEK